MYLLRKIFGKINLNSIILAAGEGKRLRPLTDNIPKCLVPLFGKSILERQVELFKLNNIFDISIVTGYCANQIKLDGATFFNNPNFQTTNMIETLFCARKKLLGSTIISYGDIIYEKEVLNKLIDSDSDISIIVDLGWKKYWESRFENTLDDAESLIIDDEGHIVEIGQKVTNFDKIHGQYIGLMKFQNKGMGYLKSTYDKAKSISKLGINPLNSNLPFEKSYMTDLLQQMIRDGYQLKAIPIIHGWLELDSFNDFSLYKKLYESNQLSKFINLIKK